MAVLFLDTSALAKLYFEESGSAHVISLASDERNQIVIGVLAEVELRAAVRKRQRMKHLDADEILQRFEAHLESGFVRQSLNQQVLDRAGELLDEYPLRAYDSMQLASCLVYGAGSDAERPCFVCADRDLLLAARSEGLLGRGSSGLACQSVLVGSDIHRPSSGTP